MHFLLALLTMGQTAPAALQIPPQDGAVLIDFEHASTVGKGQGGPVVLTGALAARGVRFNRVFVFDYAKGLPMASFAHSGTRAIEQCYAIEFCSEPIEATFGTLQTRVKVWVGYSVKHDAGSILLIALDADGRTIERRVVTVPASDSPAPIDQSMEIAFPEPRIHRIRVLAQGGLGASGLAVDDLEFDNSIPSRAPPVDQPPPTPAPPAVQPEVPVADSAASAVITVPRGGVSGTVWSIVGVVALGLAVAIVIGWLRRASTEVSTSTPVPQVHFRPYPVPGRQILTRDPRRRGEFAVRLRAHPGRGSSRLSVRDSGKVSP